MFWNDGRQEGLKRINWLDGWSQRGVILYLEANTKRVLQGLSWDVSCLTSLWAGGSNGVHVHKVCRWHQTGGGWVKLEGRVAFQRDLDSLEKWARRNCKKSSKDKSTVLGRKNTMQQCCLWCSSLEKDLVNPASCTWAIWCALSAK